MLFCYISIINTVKRGNALAAEGDLTDRQRRMERDVTIVSPLSTMLIHEWVLQSTKRCWVPGVSHRFP